MVDRLAEDVTRGFCAGRDEVRDFVESALAEPIVVAGGDVEIADDRLIVSLRIEPAAGAAGPGFESVMALFLDGGRIVEICDAPDVAGARRVRPIGPIGTAAVRPTAATAAAAVLPVGDLTRATAHYRDLGFDVEAYDGDAGYAFAALDDVRLHLAQVVDLDPTANTSAVYLYVTDADALYARWRQARVAGRLSPPVDTEYGLREGSHLDPDGNLLRFGSESAAR